MITTWDEIELIRHLTDQIYQKSFCVLGPGHLDIISEPGYHCINRFYLTSTGSEFTFSQEVSLTMTDPCLQNPLFPSLAVIPFMPGIWFQLLAFI